MKPDRAERLTVDADLSAMSFDEAMVLLHDKANGREMFQTVLVTSFALLYVASYLAARHSILLKLIDHYQIDEWSVRQYWQDGSEYDEIWSPGA